MEQALKAVFDNVVTWVVDPKNKCQLERAENNGDRGGMISFSPQEPGEPTPYRLAKVVEIRRAEPDSILVRCGPREPLQFPNSDVIVDNALKEETQVKVHKFMRTIK